MAPSRALIASWISTRTLSMGNRPAPSRCMTRPAVFPACQDQEPAKDRRPALAPRMRRVQRTAPR